MCDQSLSDTGFNPQEAPGIVPSGSTVMALGSRPPELDICSLQNSSMKLEVLGLHDLEPSVL